MHIFCGVRELLKLARFSILNWCQSLCHSIDRHSFANSMPWRQKWRNNSCW